MCLLNRVIHNVSGNLIYLWNPSTRKLKKPPDTCLSKLENVIPGFAYLPDSNEYEVVRISCRLRKMGSPTKAEAEVYTLSSDSWQRVMLGPNVSVSNIGYDLPVPFVNGVLHWMICISESEEEPQAAKILTFDVNN